MTTKQRFDELVMKYSKELTLSIFGVLALIIVISFLPAVIIILLGLKAYEQFIN